jgi:flagellar biosynthetic protein FliQ
MSADSSMHMLAQLLWKAVMVSAPLLLTVLVVGLAISVLQVVTQIQEMTLTFIPKLLASVLVVVLAGPWMLGQLVTYSVELIRAIPRLI